MDKGVQQFLLLSGGAVPFLQPGKNGIGMNPGNTAGKGLLLDFRFRRMDDQMDGCGFADISHLPGYPIPVEAAVFPGGFCLCSC